jgi:predicted transcriptional regulator
MNIILSIKHKYCVSILNGNKKIEFRKKFPKEIEYIFIYSSKNIRMIVAIFRPKSIVIDSVNNLWNRFKDDSGLNKAEFYKYYESKVLGYAISIENLRVLKKPINPNKLFQDFKPPQNYSYIKGISCKFCKFQKSCKKSQAIDCKSLFINCNNFEINPRLIRD